MAYLFPLEGKRVLVTGHLGMVGSALARRLSTEKCDVRTLGRDTTDLRRQSDTEAAITAIKPDAIFVASAKVGGILANTTMPADFLYDNLSIAANIIESARRAGVQKLLYLGSSCIYPRMARQPISEKELLNGPLEPTNQWYAIAKIAGLKLCAAYRRQYGCDFISAQPTNLYGPGDNYDLRSSHVIPALIAKAHAAKLSGAKSVEIWGTGNPRREFLHVDDLADALVFLMKNYSEEEHINVGWGKDISIAEVARLIQKIVGFEGELAFDRSKPDGTPQKLLDISRINAAGWTPKIGLKEGLENAYAWYIANKAPQAG